MYGANRWLSMRLSLLGSSGVWSLAFLALVLRGSSVSTIALAITFSLELRQQFNLLIQNAVSLESAMQSGERIRQLETLMEQEPVGGEELQCAGGGAIEFSHVTVTYRPQLPPSLVDVSFRVAAGTKVGVCGRTGSGKSTLLRALHRLVPYEGSICIDHQELGSVNVHSLRERAPAVTQSSLSLAGTVRDTVDPARALTEEQVLSALSAVGLGHVALDTEASTLSVGELQLASFCRAVASVHHRGASLLLLDEASSSIDHVSEGAIQRILQPLRVTTIVIAHRLATILACDELLVLDGGRLVECGTPEQLNRPGTRFYDLIVQPPAQ